jgi:poly(3-hydroxybutyrate) depolymerase
MLRGERAYIGMSHGAMMSYRLAAEAPDPRISATGTNS